MQYSLFSLIIILLICSFGCERNLENNNNNFFVKIEKRLSWGPCSIYKISIDSDGNFLGERNCSRKLKPSECNLYESNGISTEKRPCFKNTTETKEKQLNEKEINEIITEINKSNFFSFEDDYGFDSKNCSQIGTDMPNSIITIKLNEKEKTIDHYYGCWVNGLVKNENALKPLKDLEEKIGEITGTEDWG